MTSTIVRLKRTDAPNSVIDLSIFFRKGKPGQFIATCNAVTIEPPSYPGGFGGESQFPFDAKSEVVEVAARYNAKREAALIAELRADYSRFIPLIRKVVDAGSQGKPITLEVPLPAAA